jgi:hypothetical protein
VSGRRDAAVVAAGSAAILVAWLWLLRGHQAPSGWPGVDEVVVGHFAAAAGARSAPLWQLPQGDTLLFAFLLAGLLAGFVLGFCARAVAGRDAGELR